MLSLLYNFLKPKKMKTKITIGTEVRGSLGTGIIEKIITLSTGYVQVNYNGRIKKEMAFNLTDMNGDILKAKPVKSEPKILTTAEKNQNKISSAKQMLLSVNDRWNMNSDYKMACQIFGKINSNGNKFIDSLLHYFFFKNSLSENQAYYLAKFAVETGIF